MTAPQLIAILEARGIRLFLDEDGTLTSDRPKRCIPAMPRKLIAQMEEELTEYLLDQGGPILVSWQSLEVRLSAFRAQAGNPRALDYLHMPWAPVIPGACLSCGAELKGPYCRCYACLLAARLVREEHSEWPVDTVIGATMRRHGIGRRRAICKVFGLERFKKSRKTWDSPVWTDSERSIEEALARIRVVANL